ncbi:MAG: response regulator, partial [Myxococcota bacterium]
GERVLLVDDDEMVRRSIQRLLERQGFVAESVGGGREALARVAAPHDPQVDVMLLDVAMPDIDGIETLRTLRETHPTLPVLLYSGYPDRVQSTLELDQHTAFSGKPFEPGRLTAQLIELMTGTRTSTVPGAAERAYRPR